MADDINLPNLISHLAVNLNGLSGTVADAGRQGSSVGAALGGGIQRELRDLLAHLPTIDVDASTDEVDRDLARVRQQLDDLAGQRIGVDVSIEDALRRLEELEPHLQRLSDTHPNVNVQATTRAALRQLEELRAAARRVDDTDVDIDVDVDTDGPQRLTGILRGLRSVAGNAAGALAGVGRATAGIGAAVPLVATVVQSLANVAPAAGVAVTGLAAVKLAQGTVKLAAVGMDDALTAALDPEKAEDFEKSLAKLSPEARKFARAVRDAAPALRDLQQDVQDRVFDGLADSLQRTGSRVLPVLRKNLLSTGDALNKMAKGVSNAAAGLAANGTLGRALGSATKGLHNLSGVPAIVVKSLGQIAAAAGPSFERLTGIAADAAEKIGKRLDKAFTSGAMEDAIEDAIDLLGDLWEVGENVAEIIGGIFRAVPEGGGLIGTLQEVTQALADAVNSPEVQDGLRSLFEVMSTLAKTAAPLLAQALGLIAPILSEIGPPLEEFIVALGDALQPILDDLGPVLVELAGAFKEIVLALIPLLPPLSELIVSLLPVLQYFLRGTAVIIRNVVAPVLLMFVTGVQKIVEWLSILTGWLSGRAAQGIRGFAQLLRGDFSGASASANRSIADMSIGVAQRLSSLPGKVAGSTASFVSVIRGAGRNASSSLLRSTSDMIEGARRFIASLPSKAVAALGNTGRILWDAGRRLIQGFIDGISANIGSLRGVLSGITSMIPQVKGPPSKDAKLLTPAGKLIIEGFIRGIEQATPGLRSRLQQLTTDLPRMLRTPTLGLDVAATVGGAVRGVPTAGQLAATYSRSPGDMHNVINLYGGDASPDGIVRALSWQSLVRGR
ncbi:hypothetical protein [Streptomyces flaveolus]|uniref:hypothetical protein n=1 Tax=Streptomyces flaveolus TaxID=67297 RepID=UPI003441FD2E